MKAPWIHGWRINRIEPTFFKIISGSGDRTWSSVPRSVFEKWFDVVRPKEKRRITASAHFFWPLLGGPKMPFLSPDKFCKICKPQVPIRTESVSREKSPNSDIWALKKGTRICRVLSMTALTNKFYAIWLTHSKSVQCTAKIIT